jgi:hypothetical protein
MKRIAFVALFAFVICHAVAAIAAPTPVDIWDLQAVKADGGGTHESLTGGGQIVVEGILLNQTQDYLNDQTYQVFVQGDGGGGVAVYAGAWYYFGDEALWQATYARMQSDPTSGHVFQAGDRVRVTGHTLFYRGKTNINEQHESDDEYNVTIELLETGGGMPTPNNIPSVAECIYFDADRNGGGELYQGTWSQLQDVRIIDGAWENDGMVLVTDNGTDTIPVHLSAMGDFDLYSAPTGSFSVTGVFNQEDESEPYTGDYRLWVKSYSDFSFGGDDTSAPVPEPSALVLAMMGLGAGLARNKRRTM